MVGLSVWLRRWQTLRAQLHPLATRLESDPSYRLRSLQEVHLAADLGFSLDVNQAEVDDWLRLPGLSIRQAQTLVQLRRTGVQFHDLEDVAAALGVTPGQLLPLARVLAFRYYDGESPLTLDRVNVNQSTAAQLGRVPGVTAPLAQAIIQERNYRGGFRNMADFQARLKLPPELVMVLMHHLHC